MRVARPPTAKRTRMPISAMMSVGSASIAHAQVVKTTTYICFVSRSDGSVTWRVCTVKTSPTRKMMSL